MLLENARSAYDIYMQKQDGWHEETTAIINFFLVFKTLDLQIALIEYV